MIQRMLDSLSSSLVPSDQAPPPPAHMAPLLFSDHRLGSRSYKPILKRPTASEFSFPISSESGPIQTVSYSILVWGASVVPFPFSFTFDWLNLQCPPAKLSEHLHFPSATLYTFLYNTDRTKAGKYSTVAVSRCCYEPCLPSHIDCPHPQVRPQPFLWLLLAVS